MQGFKNRTRGVSQFPSSCRLGRVSRKNREDKTMNLELKICVSFICNDLPLKKKQVMNLSCYRQWMPTFIFQQLDQQYYGSSNASIVKKNKVVLIINNQCKLLLKASFQIKEEEEVHLGPKNYRAWPHDSGGDSTRYLLSPSHLGLFDSDPTNFLNPCYSENFSSLQLFNKSPKTLRNHNHG